ncbi:MAG: hypothetical protein ACOYK6_06720 [Chthoniobacterales bacterium]
MQPIATSPVLRRKSSRRDTLSHSKKTRLRSSTKKTTAGRYVTIYLSNRLASHYEDQAIMLNTTVGKLLKKQIEAKPATVFDALKDLIEDTGSGPADLSTNPAYFEGFGEDIKPVPFKK